MGVLRQESKLTLPPPGRRGHPPPAAPPSAPAAPRPASPPTFVFLTLNIETRASGANSGT